MNNNSESDLSRPNIDDSTLDRHLASLPGFDPFVGFEDRVMSRVLVPPPHWVQGLKQSARSLADTRRFRWLAAGLMTTSFVSLVVMTALVWTNYSTVSQVVNSAATTVGLPLWRSFVELTSNSVLNVFSFSDPLLASRGSALLTVAATVGFLAFSAGMLACLMSPKCLARSE